MFRTTSGLVDPANRPSAAVDGVVRSVLVDPGTEAGRAHLEGHHIPSLLGIHLPYCSAFRYHGADNEAGTIMKSRIVKRSVVLAGHKTSVSLEDEFWTTLKEIAGDRHVTLSELVSDIDKQRQHGNLSSALRLFVLEYYRGKAAAKPSEMLDQQAPPPAPVLL
jgi:predicted DNA-binding ribbon-helix-helix protein